MGTTLLLDQSTWDLVIDANGNIALASEPFALAQDAASAIKTYLGECYWNTTVGVPYAQIYGQVASLAALKALFIAAALTVPDVASAEVFFSSFSAITRVLTGQVQVTGAPGSVAAGQTSIATFTITNPQGTG